MAPAVHSAEEKDLNLQRAIELDNRDPLRRFRNEFLFPTQTDLKSKIWPTTSEPREEADEPCIYLCGNSLGLQPRRTLNRVSEHLSLWAKKGVLGHFAELQGNAPTPFLHLDDVAAQKMAAIVGALHSEVAVMETLSANLHLLMASFYKPTKEKYKVILEGKAFPSDNYVVESQIAHHGLVPRDAMVLVDPIMPAYTISTEQILATIDENASSTALILLPGVQYYTGQRFDIERITAYAHKKGLIIGWDLAHSIGNVELRLHDWQVDFAAWCTYKYLNSGPGAIAGLFVHEKHGHVDSTEAQAGGPAYRSRLSGWWGNDKKSRFNMEPGFIPVPGAAGFQLGNPSALAVTAVLASLEIFSETTMDMIRTKSVLITGFLEALLLSAIKADSNSPYWIITPSDPEERGAQLSIQLEPGLLEGVCIGLEEEGVITDERKPDVIRVAPVPLYNTYREVWNFVKIFDEVCRKAKQNRSKNA